MMRKTISMILFSALACILWVQTPAEGLGMSMLMRSNTPQPAAKPAKTSKKVSSKMASKNAAAVPAVVFQDLDTNTMAAICVQTLATLPTGRMGRVDRKETPISSIQKGLSKLAKSKKNAPYAQRMEDTSKCIIKALESSIAAKIGNPSSLPSARPPKVDKATESLKAGLMTILGAFCKKGIDDINTSTGVGVKKKEPRPKKGAVNKKGAASSSQTPDGKDKKTTATGYQTAGNDPQLTYSQRMSYFARCVSTMLGTGYAALRVPLPTNEYKKMLLELSTKLIQNLPSDKEMEVTLIKREALRAKDDKVKFEKYPEAIIKALADLVPQDAPAKKGYLWGTQKARKKTNKKSPSSMAPDVREDQKDVDIQNLEDMCAGGLTLPSKFFSGQKKTLALEQQATAQALPVTDASQKPAILTAYAKCISLTLGKGVIGAAVPTSSKDEDDDGKNESQEDGEDQEEEEDEAPSKKGRLKNVEKRRRKSS